MVPMKRQRILDYIDSPSFEGWKVVRDIPVLYGQTLWDLMDQIDCDWPGMYPSAILVARVSKLSEKLAEEMEPLEYDNLLKGLTSDLDQPPPDVS